MQDGSNSLWRLSAVLTVGAGTGVMESLDHRRRARGSVAARKNRSSRRGSTFGRHRATDHGRVVVIIGITTAFTTKHRHDC
jgi:hypothetical protein